MKLSEAIRLGAMLKPQNTSGDLFRDGASCAIGAAMDAVGITETPHTGEDCARVRARWPIAGVVVECPHGGVNEVMYAIWDLNDSYCWTREQIADWVQTIEEQQPVKDIQDPVHVPAEVA